MIYFLGQKLFSSYDALLLATAGLSVSGFYLDISLSNLGVQHRL